MPKGFLILLLVLGVLLLTQQVTRSWPMALFFPLILGGGFDCFVRTGVRGVLTWGFLLFFGAVAGILMGNALSSANSAGWSVAGASFGALIWVVSYQVEKRAHRPLTRRPAALALILMIATAICAVLDAPPYLLGILLVGCFLTFVWWSWAAFQGFLRLNPERQAIERECERLRRR